MSQQIQPRERATTSATAMAPMFKGVRTFTLDPQGDGTTTFTME